MRLEATIPSRSFRIESKTEESSALEESANRAFLSERASEAKAAASLLSRSELPSAEPQNLMYFSTIWV